MIKKYLNLFFVVFLILAFVGISNSQARGANSGSDDNSSDTSLVGNNSTDDDGTPDQGRGDFNADGTRVITPGDDDGTPDQGRGDFNAAGTRVITPGDDDGTPDQGRGDFNAAGIRIDDDNGGLRANKIQRELFKNKLEDLKNQIKNEKDVAKAKIKEIRITGRENALGRFDAAVLRMNNLKDRINDQITKLTVKEVDVANAKVLVATAEAKLNAANVKITEINAILATSINTLTAAQKAKLVTLAKDTQDLIKDAHQALRGSIKSLKDAVKIELDKLKLDNSNSGTGENN